MARMILIVLALFCAPAFAQQFKLIEGAGIHLFSRHDPYHGENQVNFGGFARLNYGFVVGFYKNSLGRNSDYYGWSTPEWNRMRLSVLSVSGYKKERVVVPIPSFKLYQFDSGPALWLSGTPVQITDSRAVGHIHLEWSFK